MKNFMKKYNPMLNLRYQIDDHVNKVFRLYTAFFKINFNAMETWEPEDNEIYFTGQDGCMSCYDSESLRIPLKFFIDPEKEFKKLEEERIKEMQASKDRQKREKERIAKNKELNEKRQYEKLRKKFEVVS